MEALCCPEKGAARTASARAGLVASLSGVKGKKGIAPQVRAGVPAAVNSTCLKELRSPEPLNSKLLGLLPFWTKHLLPHAPNYSYLPVSSSAKRRGACGSRARGDAPCMRRVSRCME